MLFSRKDLLNLAEEFIHKCEINDIWYVADDMTLLGTQKYGSFVPWCEKIQVMMTVESYEKFQRLFPIHIIDGVKDKNYLSLKPSFVKDRNNWSKQLPSIEIRIIVPTTLKQINNWRSIFIYVWDVLTRKKNNIRNAINDLQVRSYEGYYTITSRFSSIRKNWIYNISFKTKKAKFHTINIAIPIEYKAILQNWFGQDYMKFVAPKKLNIFSSSIKTIEESI